MRICYPGSFDPISNGHLDIIKRLANNFSEVVILISNNINKHYSFTPEERANLIKIATTGIPNVKIDIYSGLVVHYCQKENITLMARGLRNVSDYEAEFNLFQFNRDLDHNIETILLYPSSKNQFVSSSAIKELVTFGADIAKYVPKAIIPYIEAKFKQPQIKQKLL